MAQTMQARNAVSAKMAECYITIDGNRYNFMSAIKSKPNIITFLRYYILWINTTC